MPTQSSNVLLQCESLSREFGAGRGIVNVSITLREGDVLGLLGLNGAGKSTTLKILAGCLVQDSGSVAVAGHTMEDAPMEARREIGYLPDQPPLYEDMRVDAYLSFAAQLRRVPKSAIASRIDTVIRDCDLSSVKNDRIAKLSKGFRQRVGVAQALIHEPKVLLLDEPSNGLDPQQLHGMRSLIINVGKHNSVIFSTHLLGEAQAVCNRIAVMHEGKLVADMPTLGNTEELDKLFTTLVKQHPEKLAMDAATA